MIHATPSEVLRTLSDVCEKVLIPGLESSLRGEADPAQLKLNLTTALMLKDLLRHPGSGVRDILSASLLPASSMKPAPFRLLPSAYPFAIELQTRFGDLDVLGHLNNAALARLYEEARSRFSMARFADLRHPASGPRDWMALVANVNISYLGEAHYPAPVTITCGIGSIGNRSYVVSHALFQEARCVGVCDCALVLVSKSTRKAMAIPEALRERLGGLMLDEQAR